MKLLLNDKEIINFLIDFFCKKKNLYQFPECKFSLAEGWARHQKETINYDKKYNKKFNLEKTQKGVFKDLEKKVKADLTNYLNAVNEILDKRKFIYTFFIKNNLEKIIETLGEEVIFEQYKKSKTENFVKSVGLQLTSTPNFIRRKNFFNVTENCLLRNTVGNEQILLEKIQHQHPFWFIDSGYTNFIENSKKWHRLVYNHLHIGKFFDAPSNRLENFQSFPMPWRKTGEKILVIEPGQFAANIFSIDLTNWRSKIENEIRQHTDRPIVFREKAPKKIRENLYDHLLKEDYYCTISINSNAAVESVWAGIPIITLDKHITNPISRNSIADINNLLRPNIASWLAMLSYSQFTFEELVNGTALQILSEYHE